MNTPKLLAFLTAFLSLMLNTAYGGDSITGSVNDKIVFSVSAAEGEILIQSASNNDAGQEPDPAGEPTTETLPPPSTTDGVSATEAPGGETDENPIDISDEQAPPQSDSETLSHNGRMITSFYERRNIRIRGLPDSSGWMRLTIDNDPNSAVDFFLGDLVEPSENPNNQDNQNNQTETFFTRVLNAIQNWQNGSPLSEPEHEVIRTLVSAMLNPYAVGQFQRMMVQGPASPWSPRRTWVGSQLHNALTILYLTTGYDHVSSTIRVPTNIGEFTHDASNEAYRIDGSVSITFSSQRQPENYREVGIQLAVPDTYSAKVAEAPTTHCRDGKKTEAAKDHDKDPDGKNPDSYYRRFIGRLASLRSSVGWKIGSSQVSESSGSGQSDNGNKQHMDSMISAYQLSQDNQYSASYSPVEFLSVARTVQLLFHNTNIKQNIEVPVELRSISGY